MITSLAETSDRTVRCISIEGDGAEVTRLKRMGICAGHQLEIVQAGDPMILRVIGSQVGLSRQLARRVVVETLPSIAPVQESGTRT